MSGSQDTAPALTRINSSVNMACHVSDKVLLTIHCEVAMSKYWRGLLKNLKWEFDVGGWGGGGQWVFNSFTVKYLDDVCHSVSLLTRFRVVMLCSVKHGIQIDCPEPLQRQTAVLVRDIAALNCRLEVLETWVFGLETSRYRNLPQISNFEIKNGGRSLSWKVKSPCPITVKK